MKPAGGANARIAALGLSAAMAMVASFEGVRNYAYLDPVGIPTICAGHIQGVKLGDYKTDEECRELLGEEFYASAVRVDRCVPHLLAPNELGALSSADFNLGAVFACDTKNSRAARLLKAGDVRGACNELPKWNKGKVGGVKVPLPGLTRRREAERKMCLGANP